MEKGVTMAAGDETQYLYHEPCHTPMKQHNSLEVVASLMGKPVPLSDRCCGEAGTLGTARPDVSNQLRFRKQEELTAGIEALTGEAKATDGKVKMLTSCPACTQGLNRYSDNTGLEVTYMVEQLVRNQFGDDWQKQFIQQATQGGIERVLL